MLLNGAKFGNKNQYNTGELFKLILIYLGDISIKTEVMAEMGLWKIKWINVEQLNPKTAIEAYCDVFYPNIILLL